MAVYGATPAARPGGAAARGTRYFVATAAAALIGCAALLASANLSATVSHFGDEVPLVSNAAIRAMSVNQELKYGEQLNSMPRIEPSVTLAVVSHGTAKTEDADLADLATVWAQEPAAELGTTAADLELATVQAAAVVPSDTEQLPASQKEATRKKKHSFVHETPKSSKSGAHEGPFKCEGPSDCGFAGDCVSGKCDCDAAWTGPSCTALALLPTKEDNGLRRPDRASWGGSVVKDGDTYHMYVADMIKGCGLRSWESASQITHATAKEATGPFKAQEVVKEVFAHNPTVHKMADGTFVIYHIDEYDIAVHDLAKEHCGAELLKFNTALSNHVLSMSTIEKQMNHHDHKVWPEPLKRRALGDSEIDVGTGKTVNDSGAVVSARNKVSKVLEAYKATPPGPDRALMGVKLLKVKKELLETIDATRHELFPDQYARKATTPMLAETEKMTGESLDAPDAGLPFVEKVTAESDGDEDEEEDVSLADEEKATLKPFPTVSPKILYSKSPNGPWKTMKENEGYGTRKCNNPAAETHSADGTVLLYCKFGIPGHYTYGVFKAADWRGPYKFQEMVKGVTGEDAFVWYSKKRAAYHMLFHTMPEKHPSTAWSRDGINWRALGHQHAAFNKTAELDNGKYVYAVQRERHQLLLDDDGEPQVLYNGMTTTRGAHGPVYSYTGAQAIRTSKSVRMRSDTFAMHSGAEAAAVPKAVKAAPKAKAVGGKEATPIAAVEVAAAARAETVAAAVAPATAAALVTPTGAPTTNGVPI